MVGRMDAWMWWSVGKKTVEAAIIFKFVFFIRIERFANLFKGAWNLYRFIHNLSTYKILQFYIYINTHLTSICWTIIA